ncbi:MAG: glutaredoxin family protein [Candidatus Vogelbacteria bacterium]
MNKKVTIYSTPTCHYCREAKEFFKAHSIAYDEHNVATDAARRKEMMDKSGQLGVPVITVSDQDGSNESLVIGFDEPQLAKLIGV